MGKPGFWDDRARAKRISQELETKRAQVEKFERLEHALEDLEVLAELAEEEGDSGAAQEAEEQLQRLSRELDRLELEAFLSGPYDEGPCYLTIQAGAGGTDAQDWAEMLLRMYIGWLERRGFRYRVLEVSPGEVAGIKSATVEVEGPYAYGYLRNEQGVHRLVRISPFDANKRRHTSFAAVSVTPIVEDPEIEIREEDLRIDTYRASGAGGQYVNKTDSAVRITHLPTGEVVQCQNERSQHKNKASAMKALRGKLYQLEEAKRDEELAKFYGDRGSITWGNQIRSYVMHPYQMVKDLRTNVETSDIDRVLNGDIDKFIEAYLKGQE